MDESVVVAAEEDTVFQAGFAVVCPVFDVMTLAPAWGPPAAGEGAALVPRDQGSADRSADGASFPSDVEHLSLPGKDDGQDLCVAGQLPDLGGAELRAVVQAAGADFAAELVVVDGHHDLWSIAAVLREFAALVRQFADRDQRVGPTLRWGAWVGSVFGGPGGAQRVDCGA